MANATAIVKKGTVRRTDEFIKLPLSSAAAARTFYPNAMLGVAADGYVDKFDDTQAMCFLGVVRPDEGKLEQPVSSDGDYEIGVHQPQAFELAVSGVAEADKGRLVYASDDQTGAFTPGTYGNVVGRVKAKVATGIALVEPEYTPVNGDRLQVLSGDGAIQIPTGGKTLTVLVTKGSAAAITIADPTTGLHDGLEVTVLSTTAFAHTVTRSTTGFNDGGAAADVATFGAAKGNSMTIVAYAGKWYAKNLTGVTLA